MNPQLKKPTDLVRSVIEQGKLFDTKQSAFKWEETSSKFNVFGGEEIRKSYPEYALYNTSGKNPFDGNKGSTLGIKFYSMGANFEPFDLAGPNFDFAPLKALNKVLNLSKVKVTLGKDEVRSFFLAEAHDPIPQVINHLRVGAGITPANVTTAAVLPPPGSIENERNIIRLPLKLQDGLTLKFEGELLGGIQAGAALANTFLVARLFVIEEKSENK
ncbi:hypothetical protein CH354_10055 [Leptospira levettii]|uniref:hypothetical protein n=1 Tax=Leptospira levettii TaxID=2023178 RepID=UPI000C2B5363|nr:hypothetical protein [Leptospira levettii]PJZ37394.1 hypothetical protein CH354_10055 [Leptospira levettii]